MINMEPRDAHAPLPAWRAWVYAGVTIGVLDILDAFVFFWLRSGVRPVRILQSVASGVLGKGAYTGGTQAAALGLALHFVIAFTIAGVFILLSRRFPFLRRPVLVWGPLYGIAVYLVMNQVVVPLSQAAHGAKPLPVIVNGVLIHILAVGLPSAWFASRIHPHRE
jgi:hypothetical protein